MVVLHLNSANFPDFPAKQGKGENRDEFADDCSHRHDLTPLYR